MATPTPPRCCAQAKLLGKTIAKVGAIKETGTEGLKHAPEAVGSGIGKTLGVIKEAAVRETGVKQAPEAVVAQVGSGIKQAFKSAPGAVGSKLKSTPGLANVGSRIKSAQGAVGNGLKNAKHTIQATGAATSVLVGAQPRPGGSPLKSPQRVAPPARTAEMF